MKTRNLSTLFSWKYKMAVVKISIENEKSRKNDKNRKTEKYVNEKKVQSKRKKHVFRLNEFCRSRSRRCCSQNQRATAKKAENREKRE